MLNYNGKILKDDSLLISPDNRSFRYGDGFFETIKVISDKVLLADYHFERLFSSLELLKFEKPSYLTGDYLHKQILELVEKNGHSKAARVRLTFFRGNGGLYDPENHFPNYIIQSWGLENTMAGLNENGLVTDIFPDAQKACDRYANVKSNNYLSYAMAALWAKEQKLNDAIILNSFGRVADSTIANLFIVKDGIIKTPALTEGCVAGVMRRYLLGCLKKEGIPFEETQISVEDVLQASELFLTNAIRGIVWVRQLRENTYQNKVASLLHKKFIYKFENSAI